MLQTRRGFLATSGLLTLIPSSAIAGGPWWEKNPDQWTADDLDKVLNHSEWVRRVMLTYLPSSSHGKASRQREGVETSSEFACDVRWESALPVRLARRFTGGPKITDDKTYVLSINNLPVTFLRDSSGGISGKSGQDEEQAKQDIAAQLRGSALLQRGSHEPIHSERADWVRTDFSSSVIVSFAGAEHPIQVNDGEVTFFSQIGVFLLRATFSLKRMTYRGKLEV